jgi:hypothetical protein
MKRKKRMKIENTNFYIQVDGLNTEFAEVYFAVEYKIKFYVKPDNTKFLKKYPQKVSADELINLIKVRS